MNRLYSGFILLFFLSVSAHLSGQKLIQGISVVAPPDSIRFNPLSEVKDLGANWVTLIPYGYCRVGMTEVRHGISQFQWWGEQAPGIRTQIKWARSQGLSIMLKPQIFVPGSWTGGIDFESEEDWQLWESSYLNYINLYVNIAIENNVEVICIGTELRQVASKRPLFWQNLIQDIRSKYSGKLTYAANWDDYQDVTFWPDLDFIGIDAYFPLSENITPSVEELMDSWNTIMIELKVFSEEKNKPILFTEYGYLSVDGTAGKHWEILPNVKNIPINEQAQANAIEALWRACFRYDFWKGGFLWKWFPNGKGHEGYVDRDFTPQGKRAEGVLRGIFLGKH